MDKYTIQMEKFEDIKQFVNIASRMDADIDVIHGHYTVDAKSILGVLSLDFSSPLHVLINEKKKGEEENFINELKISGFKIEKEAD